MQIGSLVQYKQKYHRKRDAIGIAIDTEMGGIKWLIQWNSGRQQWIYCDYLEVINESR